MINDAWSQVKGKRAAMMGRKDGSRRVCWGLMHCMILYKRTGKGIKGVLHNGHKSLGDPGKLAAWVIDHEPI